MGWVVCFDAVLESRDTVLIIVVTASRCIRDAVSSHCREILEPCWCRTMGFMVRTQINGEDASNKKFCSHLVLRSPQDYRIVEAKRHNVCCSVLQFHCGSITTPRMMMLRGGLTPGIQIMCTGLSTLEDAKICLRRVNPVLTWTMKRVGLSQGLWVEHQNELFRVEVVGQLLSSVSFRPKSLGLLIGTADIGGFCGPEDVMRPGMRSPTTLYCFNVADDPKTFAEAMKSQDVVSWK
ncbi:hypothetical protein Tco_1217492 [Tanacetum coccineum]